MARRNWRTSTVDQPAFDCLEDGHLFLDWRGTGDFTVRQKIDPVPTAEAGIRAGWCLWCGTAAYDPDIDTDNTAT